MGPFDSAWLVASVGLSIPLIWAALGELISERGGVLNIGLEGMVSAGAFAAFAVAWATESAWLGVLGGIAAGIVLASIMAFFCINGGADQIVVGLGLLILAGGATHFADRELFAGRERVTVPTIDAVDIPVLVDIPVIGEPLFSQTPLAYAAFIAVPLVLVLLWRTHVGLAMRAAGEAPEAVEAAGISVHRARWTATLAAGVGGGISGAVLTVGTIGVSAQDISAGRGFIAIAAVVFGRWHPFGVLAACLIFGGADALQLRLQAIGELPREVWIAVALILAATVLWRFRGGVRPSVTGTAVGAALIALCLVLAAVDPGWRLPSQIWLTLPYVLTLIVLAGAVGRTRMPSRLGLPYRRAAEA